MSRTGRTGLVDVAFSDPYGVAVLGWDRAVVDRLGGLSRRFRVVWLPQPGSSFRQHSVPDTVVPLFFIGPAQTGHRGRFVVTGKVNQRPDTTTGFETVD